MEKIIEKIESGVRLTPDEQLKVFALPDVLTLFGKVISENFLCPDAQFKMLEHEKSKELFEIYVQRWWLCKEAQFKLIRRPDAKAFLRIYCQQWAPCEETQVKMLRFPYADEILELSARCGRVLCTEALFRLFELPNARELLTLYLHENWLGKKAELKAKELGLL